MTKKSIKKKPRKDNLPAVINPSLPCRVDVDPQSLIATAINGKASIDVIERLLAMRDRLNAEHAEREYRAAMAKFQEECPVIKKKKPVLNKDGKTTRYKYAPIDDIIGIAGPILSKHGLSYDMKPPIIKDGMLTATIVSHHIAGHSEETSFTVPLDTNEYMTNMQRVSSTNTFAGRIAFCAKYGIITGDEDSDGKTDPEEVKKKKEAEEKETAKLNALPDTIKEGFNHLDYKKRAIWQFCQDRDWKNETILKDINKIIDRLDNVK